MPLNIDFQNGIFKLNYFSFKYIFIINLKKRMNTPTPNTHIVVKEKPQ